MRIGSISLGAVIATLALAIAGCGSSGSSSSAASSSSSSAGSGSAGNSSSSSAAAPTFANTGNCLQLAGVGEKFAQAMQSATGKTFNLSAAVAAYNNLANAAPSAIKPAVQTIATAFGSFASALEKVNYKLGSVPSATQLAGLESAVHVFEQSNVKQAETSVAAWAKQNCS